MNKYFFGVQYTSMALTAIVMATAGSASFASVSIPSAAETLFSTTGDTSNTDPGDRGTALESLRLAINAALTAAETDAPQVSGVHLRVRGGALPDTVMVMLTLDILGPGPGFPAGADPVEFLDNNLASLSADGFLPAGSLVVRDVPPTTDPVAAIPLAMDRLLPFVIGVVAGRQLITQRDSTGTIVSV